MREYTAIFICILICNVFICPKSFGQTDYTYKKGKSFKSTNALSMTDTIDLTSISSPIPYKKSRPGQIQTIVTPLLKDYYNNDDIPNSLEDVTNAFLNHVQKSDLIEPLIKEFKNSQNIFGDLESSDRESIETIGLIATLSYDMYIRKRLIEKLIDSLPSSKGDTGKDKK